MTNDWHEKYGEAETIFTDDDDYQLQPALLDGKPVKPAEIDPVKHEFMGTFRPPSPDPRDAPDYALQQWQRGAYDRLSYRTK